MRVALFITCFNDTLFPATGRATVEVLERLGHEVVFPEVQTCCGQMHFNTGYQREAIPLAGQQPPRAPRRLDGRQGPQVRPHAVFQGVVEGGAGLVATEAILWRVRRATRDVPEGERPEDVPVERGYRTEDDAPRDEIVARFAENVAEYEATVHRVDEADLPARIAEMLEGRCLNKLVVPPLLPEAWIADGVLTGCALGISQTGTIVLDAGPAQGRRAHPATRLPPVRCARGAGSGPSARGVREAGRGRQGRGPGRQVHLRPVRDLGHRAQPGRGWARPAGAGGPYKSAEGERA